LSPELTLPQSPSGEQKDGENRLRQPSLAPRREENPMQKHPPSPNDQRSDVKNPTSPRYETDRQHRIDAGHPNVPPPAPQAPAQPARPAQPKKG
jgi:hypothetical protein